MTHFLCTRVRRGFLPCQTQCADCRAEEDSTTPGPLAMAPPAMVCYDCGRPRRPTSVWCQCGGAAFVQATPIGLVPMPIPEAVEHHPLAVIRGVEAVELPGDSRTWDAWDTATITMDLQP